MASNPQKHLYPLKIALRAQRLIQASLFYDVFVDTATGQYVKTVPNAEGTIKDFLINNAGWSEETYETSWGWLLIVLSAGYLFIYIVLYILSH